MKKNRKQTEDFYHLIHNGKVLEIVSSETQPCKPGDTFTTQSTNGWNPSKKMYKVQKIKPCITGGFDVICEFVKEQDFFNKN